MKKVFLILLLAVVIFLLASPDVKAEEIYNFKEIKVDGKDKNIIPIGKKSLQLLDLKNTQKDYLAVKKNSFKLPDVDADMVKHDKGINDMGKIRDSYFKILGATHSRYLMELKDTFNSKYSDQLHYVLFGKRESGQGFRLNDNFSRTSFGFEAGKTLNDESELTGTLEFLRAIEHLPGPASFPTVTAKNDDRSYSLGGEYLKKLSPYNSLEITSTYSGFDRLISETNFNDNWEYNNNCMDLKIQYNKYLQHNSLLSFGYYLKHDRLNRNNLLTSNRLDSLNTTINKLFVKRDINLSENSFLILQLDYLYETDLSGFILPKLDFKYIFTDRLRLDLHYGKGYEGRNFKELYLDKTYVPIQSNLGYKKEDYVFTMLEFDYQFEPGYKAFMKIYKKDFSNYHYFDDTYASDRYDLSYTNGSTSFFGINTGAKFKFSPLFRCNFKYNLLLTDYRGKDLPNIPENQLDINMEYDLTPNLTLKMDEKIVGQYYSDISNTKLVSSIILVNTEINFKVNSYIRPYIGIENLFNKQYSTRYDHPGEGRVYYGGVDFKF